MKKDKNHIKMRNKVELLLDLGFSIEDIAAKLHLLIGTRFIRKSVKWYKYCIMAKKNQKMAISKHPGLYSKAGKIAQQKHPWLGRELGKKYGPIQGKKNAERLRGNSKYFSKIARRLHEINPEHSRRNMKKAHNTMKREGTFYKHQFNASLKCMEKHPNQLKEMSRKAHALYPLAQLARESRRRHYPYRFMDCFFDSFNEMKLCMLLVENGLMEKPIEGKNVHFHLYNHHIDFFVKKTVFIEYHPPIQYGGKNETLKSYYKERRKLLDSRGYKEYPLIVFDRLNRTESKINKIKKLIALKLNHRMNFQSLLF